MVKTHMVEAYSSIMKHMGSVAFISSANLAGATYVVLIEAALGLLPTQGIPSAAWPPMLGLVGFSTVLPALLFTEGLRRIGASRASLLSLIGPPTTIGAAALVIGEFMSLTQLLGCAIVVIGVATLKSTPPPTAQTLAQPGRRRQLAAATPGLRPSASA